MRSPETTHPRKIRNQRPLTGAFHKKFAATLDNVARRLFSKMLGYIELLPNILDMAFLINSLEATF